MLRNLPGRLALSALLTILGVGSSTFAADKPTQTDRAAQEAMVTKGSNYLLTQGRQAFVRQFCRKLLGYSLGRAVQLSDEPLLDDVETQLEKTGYYVGTVIDIIVASRQFREIRGGDHEQEHE